MASGQSVLKILAAYPPAANAAYQLAVAGGSTPAEQYWPFAFNDAVDRYMDFLIRLVNYGGGGLTARLALDTSTGTAGNNARFGIGFRRAQDNTNSMTGSLSYAFTTGDYATPGTRGRWRYQDVAITNGANMDNLADGEYGIMRIVRNGGHANDTVNGIVLLHGVSAIET